MTDSTKAINRVGKSTYPILIHVPDCFVKPWESYQQHHQNDLAHFGTTPAAQMWHGDAHMNSAELLRGFFSFYATDFVWGSEAWFQVDETDGL